MLKSSSLQSEKNRKKSIIIANIDRNIYIFLIVAD